MAPASGGGQMRDQHALRPAANGHRDDHEEEAQDRLDRRAEPEGSEAVEHPEHRASRPVEGAHHQRHRAQEDEGLQGRVIEQPRRHPPGGEPDQAEAEEGHRALGQERKLQCGEGERRLPPAGELAEVPGDRFPGPHVHQEVRDPDDAPHERDASELLRAERPGGDQRAQESGHQDGSVREEQPSRIAQELA